MPSTTIERARRSTRKRCYWIAGCIGGLILAIINIAMPDTRRPRFYVPEPTNVSTEPGALVEVRPTTRDLIASNGATKRFQLCQQCFHNGVACNHAGCRQQWSQARPIPLGVLEDTVDRLAQSAERGIVGFDEYFDHVHFTPRGAERAAAALFDALLEAGLLPTPERFDSAAHLSERL